MSSYDPIYYIADAACWCPKHAEERYPGCTEPYQTVRDREDNPVNPVWSYQGAAHGDCCDVDGEPLYPPSEEMVAVCECDYCCQLRDNRGQPEGIVWTTEVERLADAAAILVDLLMEHRYTGSAFDVRQ